MEYTHYRIPPEECERILADYRTGMGIHSLSQKYGWTEVYIWELVARYIKGPASITVLSEDQQRAVVEDCRAGMSKEALAQKYGCSARVIGSVVYIHTGKLPSQVKEGKGKQHFKRTLQIVERRKQGASIRQIAHELGMPESAVYTVLLRAKKEGLL